MLNFYPIHLMSNIFIRSTIDVLLVLNTFEIVDWVDHTVLSSTMTCTLVLPFSEA